MRTCSGRGDCWESNGADEKYTDTTCIHNCIRKDCVNTLVCGTIQHPEWVVNFKNGVCIECSRLFGKPMEFSNDECPICLETTLCVTMLKCNHKLCIVCFKRCQYGAKLPQPDFPFPELEEEYGDNPDLLKFRSNTEIVNYEKELNKWFEKEELRIRTEQNLRLCSICRQ